MFRLDCRFCRDAGGWVTATPCYSVLHCASIVVYQGSDGGGGGRASQLFQTCEVIMDDEKNTVDVVGSQK